MSILPSDTGIAVAPATAETTVGNYFVANYPPFGFWRPEHVPALAQALDRPPAATPTDFGIYAHIPFCRKRCHFCYFRVYTDKNALHINSYIETLLAELSYYANKPLLRDRKPSFLCFGGGTPSYLSVNQLVALSEGMKRIIPWTHAKEIAFEGEPGTLTAPKLKALRDIGVTRLSLGIEHLDDRVLEINGRAHRSKEVYRSYAQARDLGFDQINVDLIAGMVEETEEKWADTVAKVIEMSPDSVTIYQMEIPYNTTIYQRMKSEGLLTAPVADWATKRRWVDYAFRKFQEVGYTVAAATTVIKNKDQQFLYRQGLFDGSDLLSVGVSSFGYLGGVNYQNQHDFEPYVDSVRAREHGVYRAYPLSQEENYIREFALQLKNGSVSVPDFTRKFGRDPREQFSDALGKLVRDGFLTADDRTISVNRQGLLQIDRLLYGFFREEHRQGRYA